MASYAALAHLQAPVLDSSTMFPARQTSADLAEDTISAGMGEETIRAGLSVRRILIGHSMGAVSAVAEAIKRPQVNDDSVRLFV